MEPVWRFEHTVVCPVPIDVAWKFWTHVENWKIDADLESVSIDGPFAQGTRGRTVSKASGPIEWKLASVDGYAAIIEVDAGDALARFHWSFSGEDSATRITQRVTISGEQARELADIFGPSLAAGIPAGMQKLCTAMQGKLGEPQ